MDLTDVLGVLRALDARGVRYAVFGGLAMAAHGLDRGTRDLEVMSVQAGEQPIRVVSPRTLYEMKRDTVRPRDADDAARLRQRFGLED